jgi:hypothetical protein
MPRMRLVSGSNCCPSHTEGREICTKASAVKKFPKLPPSLSRWSQQALVIPGCTRSPPDIGSRRCPGPVPRQAGGPQSVSVRARFSMARYGVEPRTSLALCAKASCTHSRRECHQRRECHDPAHQDACRGRGWNRARYERRDLVSGTVNVTVWLHVAHPGKT